MPTSEWVASLPQKQKDFYTYPDAVYTGTDNLIEITCPVHGNFWQQAYLHKNKGCGCPECYETKRGASQKGSKESFVAKTDSVVEVAGKYEYDDVVYVNSITPVTITCPKHGPFRMTPGNHLAGKGCKKCFDERRHLNQLSNTQEFCEGSEEAHGTTYTYEKAVYVGCKNKVNITCRIHGTFWMTPDNHLQGQGCPKCKKSGYNKSKPGYLYILVHNEITKVGITNRTPNHRVKEISKGDGPLFEVHTAIYCADGEVPANVETATHRWLKTQYAQVAETFDGSTECFLNVGLPALINFVTPLLTTETE